MARRSFDILFVNADPVAPAGRESDGKPALLEALGGSLLMAQACLAKGYGVAVLDAVAEGLGHEEVVRRIGEIDPRLTVFVARGQNPQSSCIANGSGNAACCRLLKQAHPEFVTCLAVSRAGALEALSLAQFDLALFGEGALALPRLLETDLRSGLESVPGIGHKSQGAPLLSPLGGSGSSSSLRIGLDGAVLPPRLSIVFSFRNEEEVLPELLSRCRAVMRKLQAEKRIADWEFVFVDDDSTDESYRKLVEEADREGDIRIVRMSRPFGVSICVLSGMTYCSGDMMVYMDTDLQDPPEAIPSLLKVVEEDPEVEIVHTRRLSRAGESALKLGITRVGYWILHYLTASAMPIESGDFKLLKRRAMNEMMQFREKQPFMRWLVCWIGFKQAFVPYHREARAGGESHFKIIGWRVFANFFESAIVSTSTFPLIMISFIGLAGSMLCALLMVYILIQKLEGHNLPGWSAIMVSTLFIGSLQILCLGVIGLYIASIFDEVKQRPNYIVRDCYGFSSHGAGKALPAGSPSGS